MYFPEFGRKRGNLNGGYLFVRLSSRGQQSPPDDDMGFGAEIPFPHSGL